MTRHIAHLAVAFLVILSVTISQAAPRGKEGGKEAGGKEAERKPEHNEPKKEPGKTPTNEPHGNAATGRSNTAPGGSWSEPTHRAGQGVNQPNHNNDAAAGAAFNNRNTSQVTGAQGATAGAAAVNRNAPQYSGAQGAAAGAATAKHNEPPVSGAQGAAAGAATVNRNSPQYSGAQGAAAGAAVANHNTPQYSGAAGAMAGSAAVRSSYNNPHLYSEQWYGSHPGVWAPRGWNAGAAWRPATWGALAAYCGASATPVYYNYGTNVTSQAGNVMLDGQNLGTTAQFSQQAYDLAQSGAAADVTGVDDWMSLGVFAMVRNEQQHPQLILQFAINKQGVLRGNYTDELSDHTQTIQGAVDPRTQRAAWTVGENQTSVMEAGLSNMAQGEAPALIHKNGKTDHWLLVRLDQQAQDANSSSTPASQP